MLILIIDQKDFNASSQMVSTSTHQGPWYPDPFAESDLSFGVFVALVCSQSLINKVLS